MAKLTKARTNRRGWAAKAAIEFHVDARTCRAWRRQGCPEDFDRLRLWLAGRRQMPVGALNGKPSKPTTGAVTSIGDDQTGAAHVLRRMEAHELKSWQGLNRAIASGDPMQIKLMHDQWLKTAESVRKLDLAVEVARRDSQELMPVAELLRVLRAILQGLHLATVWNAEKVTAELVAGTDRWTILKKLKDAGVDSLTGSLAPLFREGQTAWFYSTLHDFATGQSTSDDEQIRHITALYLECQQAIRTNNHEPAEDEPAIARIIHRCLKRLGYETTEPAAAATATAGNQPAATKDATP